MNIFNETYQIRVVHNTTGGIRFINPDADGYYRIPANFTVNGNEFNHGTPQMIFEQSTVMPANTQTPSVVERLRNMVTGRTARPVVAEIPAPPAIDWAALAAQNTVAAWDGNEITTTFTTTTGVGNDVLTIDHNFTVEVLEPESHSAEDEKTRFWRGDTAL